VTGLEAIDLVVFDKDGTLLDFHAMWGGWARELGARLDATARRPVSPDVFAAIGFDPTTGRISPHGPLAASTMAGIADLVASVLRRWCPRPSDARWVLESTWFEPDPVASARPTADLRLVFGRLQASGVQIAVATNDDRAPTERTLAALGVAALVDALVCADDGLPVKPAPDAVLALAQRLGTATSRTAMVGDLPLDLAMGRAAGAGLVVGVLSGLGSRADLATADLVLDSIADLPDLPDLPLSGGVAPG
jgi:phosphoglycolate phosphatase-like HAD superfamily hydrolase